MERTVLSVCNGDIVDEGTLSFEGSCLASLRGLSDKLGFIILFLIGVLGGL